MASLPEEKDYKLYKLQQNVDDEEEQEDEEVDEEEQEDENNDQEEEVQEEVDENQPATSSESKTTANCNEEKGSNITYKSGKPILSITFSLSEEHPFEVNVGSTMSYKRSDKKAYPVLYEIQDLTNPSRKILIKPLKNKACMKNLPNDLAAYLEQLNVLLLDQYTAYYDPKKYETFVSEQNKFKELIVNKDTEEEGEQSAKKGIINQDVINRKKQIDILIDKLKAIKTGEINLADLDSKLLPISKQNGFDLQTFKDFLIKKKSEVFPLYLLPLKFYSNQIFMTNNGIVTNGKKIYAYNDISIRKNEIGVYADTANWDFINENNYLKATNVISGEVQDVDYIAIQLLEKQDFMKGGKRKTLSKKIKKRITKRNRK